MSKFRYPFKLFDTEQVPRYGRIEKHWLSEIFTDVFGNSRKAPSLPSTFKKFDPKWILQYFRLRSFEYGNWLSQVDRWQYFVGCSVSLFDLAKITGISPQQIGLSGTLSLAFGARGSGRALAHFEPRQVVINLTRFSDEAKSSGDFRFLEDGGVGSLGHEWAHALDFYMGYFETKNPATTWATNVLFQRLKPAGPNHYTVASGPKMTAIERAFFETMLGIMFERTGTGEYRRSTHYARIYDLVQAPANGYGEYWIDPKEIFARAVEVFLTYEGKRKGIVNPYLMKNKYISPVYCTESEYEKWAPKMRRIFAVAEDQISELRIYEDYFKTSA